jgi:hypothetical protein
MPEHHGCLSYLNAHRLRDGGARNARYAIIASKPTPEASIEMVCSLLVLPPKAMVAQHEDAIAKPMSSGSREARMMIPREHGAYAELLFPMAAVFLGGTPSRATWLLAIAALACFLANEPLLILVGHRGARVRREAAPQAKRALLILALGALAAGIPALWFASRPVQVSVLLPLLLGGAVMMMAAQGLERSAFGETTAAAALSSVALPLGLASGLGMFASFAVLIIWLIASLLGTAIVRLTVARTRAKTDEARAKVQAKRVTLIVVCLAVIAVGAAAPLAPRSALWVLAGALPVAIVVLVLAIAKASARSLRAIGWGLILANVCSLIAVVTALRLVQDLQAVKSTLPFPMF